MELLEARFWWPTIRSFAEKYVEGCEDCSRRKTIRHPQASMQPLDVPAGPWEQVGVDLITQLPKAHGFDAIMVCVDHFTKQVHAIPCTSDITAAGVADIYCREVFRLHGLPLRIVSDRGVQFTARLMQELLR